VVAVGHTRDDQAETILHRIVRGTGPRGLAGIAARRALSDSATLVRPLLDISRTEIRAYLAEIGQPFRDDASNADLSRTRARLRHDLLPRLAAEYNPKVAEALVRLGGLAAASERSIRHRVRELARRATVPVDHDSVVLKRPELRNVPPFLRAEVLRLVWRRAGWSEVGMDSERWRRLANLVRKTRDGLESVGGIEVTTSGDVLILRRPEAPTGPEAERIPGEARALDIPGAADWVGGRVVLTIDPGEPRDETIDRDCLVGPVCVRAPMPGDRFGPLGMDGHEMPLNDFFRGRRVARDDRGRVPLVCDRAGIVWVVGHRIAHRVRLTDQTEHTAGLRWESGCG
jgi:tRNA(Ile)-lysidine synthase